MASVKSSTIGSMPISSTRGSSAGASVRSKPMPARREHEADHAAGERQQHALGQQRARDAATTRAQRRAHRELLLASLGADEKQVRDVPARDEQHDAHRGQENPEDAPDVADHVLGQRAHVRLQLPSLESRRSASSGIIRAMSALAWASVTPGFSRASGLEVELDAKGVRAIELHRQQHRGIGSQELERRGQHADDFDAGAPSICSG